MFIKKINKVNLNVFNKVNFYKINNNLIDNGDKFYNYKLLNNSWNNFLIRIFNKKNSWSNLTNFSEKINLNYKFSDTQFLSSEFFKNRKDQIDIKNNTILFLKNKFLFLAFLYTQKNKFWFLILF